MRKKLYFFIVFFLILSISACTGYKPIFSSSNTKFKITDYEIAGNKNLGNQIYLKLYNLTQATEDTPNTKNIYVSIEVSKVKKAAVKNSAGKILSYKISLSTKINVRDDVSNNQILNETIVLSSSYTVQDQYSETIKLENKSIENLINETYQAFLVKLIENI